jgi:hypothetical protein
MGHDSVRAAMIYQHAASQAGKEIAESLDAKIRAVLDSRDDGGEEDDGGSAGTLVPAA